MEAKFLLIETSGMVGRVGLAQGAALLAQRSLDINYRHNRDLVPSIAAILQDIGWKPRQVEGVIVSRGPGSYTGLRVGMMSAKSFAFATGGELIAVETLACVARQAPPEICLLDVIADAQRGNLYTQTFTRDLSTQKMRPASDLIVESVASFLARRDPSAWTSGPALPVLPELRQELSRLSPPETWVPGLEALLHEGLGMEKRFTPAEAMRLEPLYFRPSSAEQKWDSLGRP